jgi:hypothetical protein
MGVVVGAMRRENELGRGAAEYRSQMKLIVNQAVRSWVAAWGALVLTDSIPASRAVVEV